MNATTSTNQKGQNMKPRLNHDIDTTSDHAQDAPFARHWADLAVSAQLAAAYGDQPGSTDWHVIARLAADMLMPVLRDRGIRIDRRQCEEIARIRACRHCS